MTFVDLRHMLSLGPRRLKIVLWLQQHPELEAGSWHFEGNLGGSGSVKMGLMQMLEVSDLASSAVGWEPSQ